MKRAKCKAWAMFSLVGRLGTAIFVFASLPLRLRNAECGMPNAECRIGNAKSESSNRDAWRLSVLAREDGRGPRETRGRKDAKTQRRIRESEIRNPKSEISTRRNLVLDSGFLIERQHANVITKNAGDKQTDLALYWNNMTDGCVRAFAFDGDSTDELGNPDGKATNIRYRPYRYVGLYHLKYDFNKCALFNGRNSMVRIGSAADIGNLSNFTVSAWVYVRSDGKGNQGQIYRKCSDAKNGVWLCVTDESNGKVKLHGRVGCAKFAAHQKSARTLSLRRWHHIAMTWNNSAKRVELYIDGAAVTPDTAHPLSGEGNQGNDSRAYGVIGNNASGSLAFDGYIADFFLYNKVLTTDEIKWLAHAGEFQVTPNIGAMGEYGKFPPGQMQSPAYAVEDREGYIWVSEFGTPRVSKLNQDGEVVKTIGGARGTGNGEFYGPWGLALDEDDNLYVADSGNNRIQVFDKHGAFLRKWGSTGEGDGQFNMPICVAVHRDSVYVADRRNWRIQKFTRDGAFIRKWGSRGAGDASRADSQFYALEGTDCDARGNLWVLDAGEGHDKNWLKQFASNGRFLRKINSEDDSCHGLSVSGDEIFVGDAGDMGSSSFCKYSIAFRKRTGYWGRLGSEKDEVLAGWGVHVTPRGTVLTTDWFGGKIQEWTKKGKFIRCIWGTRLHDNGYSIKCRNISSSPKQFYQTRTLTAEDYVVCFLAYTDGSPVTQEDVVPFADRGLAKEIGKFQYEHRGGGAYFCWGMLAATAEPWNVGVEVKAGKTVYIALPTCCPHRVSR